MNSPSNTPSSQYNIIRKISRSLSLERTDGKDERKCQPFMKLSVKMALQNFRKGIQHIKKEVGIKPISAYNQVPFSV